MRINIATKLCPFSRICGSRIIIPKTTIEVVVFPTKLRFYNREKNKKNPDLDLDLDFKGPFDKFFIFQNLEKFHVEVNGFSKEGFIRYIIGVKEEKIFIEIKKTPSQKVFLLIKNKKYKVSLNSPFFLPLKTKYMEPSKIEKLSLGMHKKQDVELIQRREDLREILPIWYALGQLLPTLKYKYEGVATLLTKCKKLIDKKDKIELEKLFLTIYKAGFRSIFSPTLLDDKFQSIINTKKLKISESASSLVLLKKGYEFIRSLFLCENKNQIEILPTLLPSFHCGRVLNLKLSIGIVHIEWSKKLLKKMILHSKKDAKIRLKLQPSIKSFRIKEKYYKASDLIGLKKDQIYYFDRFQK